MTSSTSEPSIVERLYEALVDEVRRTRPELLGESFTVAEIYQNLVPYRTHRERVGAEMNGDYEHALLRLLAGEGDYVTLESDAARSRFEEELNSIHPDTGVYRNFAACEVRLRPDRLEDLGITPGPVGFSEELAESGDEEEGGAVESEEHGGDDGGEPGGHHDHDDPGTDDDSGVELDLGPDVPASDPGVETANGSRDSGEEIGSDEGPDVDVGADGPVGEDDSPADDAGVAEADLAVAGGGNGSGGSPADEDGFSEPASPGDGVDEEGEPGGTCSWCRESLPDRDDLRFCPFCGSSVDLRPCPECGAEVESDWIFCIACGAEAGD